MSDQGLEAWHFGVTSPLLAALSHRVPAAGVSWPSWALPPANLSHHRPWTWLYLYLLNFICLAVILTAAGIFRQRQLLRHFTPTPRFSPPWDNDRARADIQSKQTASLSPPTKGPMRQQEVESVARVKRTFVTPVYVAARKKKAETPEWLQTQTPIN